MTPIGEIVTSKKVMHMPTRKEYDGKKSFAHDTSVAVAPSPRCTLTLLRFLPEPRISLVFSIFTGKIVQWKGFEHQFTGKT